MFRRFLNMIDNMINAREAWTKTPENIPVVAVYLNTDTNLNQPLTNTSINK